jgi:hypothetical protein
MAEFLHGWAIPQIAVVTSLFVLAIVIASFFVLGWRYGLFFLVMGLLLRSLLRPIAARLVVRHMARMLGLQSIAYVGLPPRWLHVLSRELGSSIFSDAGWTLDGLVKAGDRQDQALEQLFAMCEQSPSTRAILDEYGYDRGKLKTLYYALLRCGCGGWCGGHWVAASALAYPDPLRYVLATGDVDRDTPQGRQVFMSLMEYFEAGQPLPT